MQNWYKLVLTSIVVKDVKALKSAIVNSFPAMNLFIFKKASTMP